MGSVGFILGIVDGGKLLSLTFGVVRDDDLHGVEDSADTDGATVEVLANSTLQERHLVEGVEGGVAYLLDETTDALRTIPATTEAANGRHSRIVPSTHQTFLDESQQIALAHERVAEVQLVELRLAGAIVLNVVGLALVLLHPSYEEIIEGTVLHELERTEAMRHTLQVVALSVGEVVHRIGIPFVASPNVGNVHDTIEQRIPEEHIRVSHIDLCTKHECSGSCFAAVHEAEQLEALLGGTVAERTVSAGLRRRTLLLCDDLSALLVNIGTSLHDEPLGKVPKFLEVIARIVHIIPLEPQPFDVVLDALDVFRIFLRRICIVEAEVTFAAILLCDTEVKRDGLRVSDVKIAVRFGRETRLNASTILAFRQIILYLLFYEIEALLLLNCACSLYHKCRV